MNLASLIDTGLRTYELDSKYVSATIGHCSKLRAEASYLSREIEESTAQPLID